jgi:hypothetical protein
MEDLPDNECETELYLHADETLESKVLKKSFKVTFINEDKNNFKIKARDDSDTYIFHFRMADWANRKETDFTLQIHNFDLLLKAARLAIEKRRVVLSKIYDNLQLTFHYTNIFEDKTLSFELHSQLSDEEEKELIGKYYEDSEMVYETTTVDYRAEIVKYNKNFEDYGDRNIVRVTVKNIGTCVWEREVASLRCVPEFSTLICKEYYFEEDVIAGDEIEIALEFLKREEENLEPPYFTCLHLHMNHQNYTPMLVLDFDNSFTTKKTKLEMPKISYNKDNEEDNKNKINDNEEDNEENNKNKINDNEEDNEKDNKNKINVIEGDTEEDNKNAINDNEEDKKEEKKNKINAIEEEKDNKKKITKNDVKEKKETKKEQPKEKPKKEVSQKDDDENEEEKLKKMNPFQRRIYELNKKAKNSEKEKNEQKGWRKNFKK